MVDVVASAAAASPSTAVRARRAVRGLAVAAGAVALLTVSFVKSVNAGVPALSVVLAVVIVAWAACGVAELAAGAARLGWLILLGALVAAVALAATRVAALGLADAHAARQVSTFATVVAVAISVHVVVALPTGTLGRTLRRVGVACWYLAAVLIGVAAIVTSHALSPGALAVGWTLALASGVPALSHTYLGSAGTDRQRLQWFGVGAALALEVVLVAGTLWLLVAWPPELAALAVGATVLVPLCLMAALVPALSPRADRLWVHLLSVLGFSVVVSAIYLVIVLGLGKAPSGSTDHEVLGLSMVAAAIAAVGYAPARDRFVRMATGFVYGAREAPDEVVRSFGSRLTRAVPMDELLLQLAESLRKTMALESAEIYAGSGEVLERAVSVPDRGERSIMVTARERPAITRAGVSGKAWAAIWLPSLLEGPSESQIRVAPITHAGELLGLIVVRRGARADAFGDKDDPVLADLARQVGLAFHNAQLDTALQTSLDELRRQADELRASRARIVASGDAERRRVERDLHDGAQQHLVALAVNLRLAKDLVKEDPDATAEMLEDLGAAVQETIRELRELAHGIYPPLLVDSGLAEALRTIANRSPLDVDLSTAEIGRYPADVEAAVYFCCLEALQNAAKHAREAHVTVRIWEESGGLLFVVGDDGPGFDVRLAKRGHGFTNMSDRLGAVGGSVRWESELGKGTTIWGSVPVG
jgi:signal transduction histidine kinase